MEIELELYGALRDLEPGDRFRLPIDGETVADLRAALVQHAADHWPHVGAGLLRSCAFATTTEILRDGQPLPEDGRMAVLPPVSGG